MKVQETMARHIHRAGADESLRAVAVRMRRHGVGFMPAMEGTEVVGVVSDRDIVIRAVAEGMDPDGTPVREVMTPGLQSCHQDDSIEEAAERMRAYKIRRLVVMDDEGQPIGVVSLGDLAASAQREELAGRTLKDICSAP
jgi:CBS domain-containing protein